VLPLPVTHIIFWFVMHTWVLCLAVAQGGRLQDISNMLEDVQAVLQQAAGEVNNGAARAIIQDAMQLPQMV
jgi:hypothetical protein